MSCSEKSCISANGDASNLQACMQSCKDVEKCRYIFFSKNASQCHLYDKTCGYDIVDEEEPKGNWIRKKIDYFSKANEKGALTCVMHDETDLEFHGSQIKINDTFVLGSVYSRKPKGVF